MRLCGGGHFLTGVAADQQWHSHTPHVDLLLPCLLLNRCASRVASSPAVDSSSGVVPWSATSCSLSLQSVSRIPKSNAPDLSSDSSCTNDAKTDRQTDKQTDRQHTRGMSEPAKTSGQCFSHTFLWNSSSTAAEAAACLADFLCCPSASLLLVPRQMAHRLPSPSL